MPKDLAKYDDTGPDEKMAAVIATLQSEADRRVTRRVIIEKRWIDDLRNYHGQMSPSERQRFTDNPGSQVNVNITRPKTNAIIARMFDLLFPTDDRNWSIAPTPVPEMKQQEELTSVADDAQRSIAEITSQMEDAAREPGTDEKLQALDQEKKTLDSTMSEARMAADALYETLQDARDRANLMQEEIADQLTECSYEAASREAITDGCTVGCGVLKGPVLGTSLRRRWKEGENGFEMINDAEDKPGVQHVKPWGFFPDPDVKNPGDGKGVYERHLLSPTQLKRFARRDDVDKDAVRRLLKAKAKGSLDGHMAELFDLTGQQQAMRADTFHLWEYTGPIEAEDLATIVEKTGKDDEFDPLDEIHVRLWFCQGELLAWAPHLLDSNESIYSVFALQEDEMSPFGFGMPYLLRDAQAITRGAVRMMMDNAGYSTGPQLLIDDRYVIPEDGSWKFRPHKVWKVRDDAPPGYVPFATFDIPTQQEKLGAIILMAREFADEESGIPRLAQGEQGASVTKTAHGMGILMNSANVVFRRFVKAWDDRMTVPLIRRFYDFNMQFGKNEAAKGDYNIKARGASVLLVREMQSQNLLLMMQVFGADEDTAKWLRKDDMIKLVARALMLPVDEVVKTAAQVQAEERRQGVSPEMQAMQAEQEQKQADIELRRHAVDTKRIISEMETENRLTIAEIERETAMYKVGAEHDLSIEKLKTLLNVEQVRTDAKERVEDKKTESGERRLAADITLRRETGTSSGGTV